MRFCFLGNSRSYQQWIHTKVVSSRQLFFFSAHNVNVNFGWIIKPKAAERLYYFPSVMRWWNISSWANRMKVEMRCQGRWWKLWRGTVKMLRQAWYDVTASHRRWHETSGRKHSHYSIDWTKEKDSFLLSFPLLSSSHLSLRCLSRLFSFWLSLCVPPPFYPSARAELVLWSAFFKRFCVKFTSSDWHKSIRKGPQHHHVGQGFGM